jgi:large subunit ribosomal protein L6
MISVKIPSGIKVSVDGGNCITVKGSLGKNRRIFNTSLLNISVNGNEVSISPTEVKPLAKNGEKAAKALRKEIQNDIDGVTRYFEINMKSIHAHFPLTMEVKGGSFMLKNMIGERAARSAKIVGNTKVEISGQNARIYGTSLDDVSQTAANIRKASKIRKKDDRVFQDGVYYAIEE